MALAAAKGAGIVLSSDPDADRIGLEVRLGDGSWYHFDGNQIAAVLCYFLMLDPDGPQRRGLVIETLVTTKILGRIAQRAGQSWCIDDLAVGFKYVADVLKSLESSGRYHDVSCSADQLVLAAEESHGIMVVPTIKEKDATPAAMYLAALYQRLHDEGRTLFGLLHPDPGGGGGIRQRQSIDHDGRSGGRVEEEPVDGVAKELPAHSPRWQRSGSGWLTTGTRKPSVTFFERDRPAAQESGPTLHGYFDHHGASFRHRTQAEILLPVAPAARPTASLGRGGCFSS